MDGVGTVVADSQALELVHQGQCLLDEPAVNAQAAAVRRSPPRQFGGDGPGLQPQALRVRVVRPVTHCSLRLAERGTGLAADRADGAHQRQSLRQVVAFGSGQRRRQRHPCRVGSEVVRGRLLRRMSLVLAPAEYVRDCGSRLVRGIRPDSEGRVAVTSGTLIGRMK